MDAGNARTLGVAAVGGRAPGEAAVGSSDTVVGGLPGDAGVMPRVPHEGPGSDWHWRGCDDNVRFGYRVAKDFVDGRYLVARATRDIKSQVLLWNNEAGRRVSLTRNLFSTLCPCRAYQL